MCEDCEQGDTLAVVYSRRIDRRGWRPPAKVPDAPRTASIEVPPKKKSARRFGCERARSNDHGREAG